MTSENTARKVDVKHAREAIRPRQAVPAATVVSSRACEPRIFVCGVMAWLAMSPAAQAQVTAFVGGRIVDGTGKVIERGTVVIRDGRIAQVGGRRGRSRCPQARPR